MGKLLPKMKRSEERHTQMEIYFEWCHLCPVYTNIYSLLIDKDSCACRNISIQFPCVYPTVISSISGKKFSFPLFWKLIWYISMITDVFLNQKRVNVCEHMVDGIIFLEFSLSFLILCVIRNSVFFFPRGLIPYDKILNSLCDTQMSFSIRREQMYMNTLLMGSFFWSFLLLFSFFVLSILLSTWSNTLWWDSQ